MKAYNIAPVVARIGAPVARGCPKIARRLSANLLLKVCSPGSGAFFSRGMVVEKHSDQDPIKPADRRHPARLILTPDRIIPAKSTPVG
jgi:hypothetical protein